jgi:hypothetical protein
MVLLNDEEWGKWSDREIARKCVVHNSSVSRIRKDSLSTSDSENRTYTTRHGTEATMNTGNIGKHEETPAQAEPEHKEPEERQGQPQSRGVGVRLAHEAISVLKRIPLNDGLRQDAFSIIQDWIETNRGN